MCLLSFLKWSSIGYPLWIVQWDFTRRDHPGNPGGGIRVESCHGHCARPGRAYAQAGRAGWVSWAVCVHTVHFTSF